MGCLGERWLIYFQHRPDAVFTAILHAALERELGKVTTLNARYDLDAWEACYPHASRRFTMQSAIPSLERLLGASQALAVYRIAESLWLLLYECLENFCAELNDVSPGQPNGLLPVGNYRLAEIDFAALIARYFWDTDFLVPLDEIKPAGLTGSQGLGLTEDLAGYAHGWRVDTDDLCIEKVEVPVWGEHEPQWFKPDSHRYPDWDEGAG
jgi:hypothetical protein